EIPASLHFREPNPLIAWERLRVRAVAERTVWERGAGGSRIAGVSTFGFSGTNAHAVLEEWRGGGEAALAGAGRAGAGARGGGWAPDCGRELVRLQGDHAAGGAGGVAGRGGSRAGGAGRGWVRGAGGVRRRWGWICGAGRSGRRRVVKARGFGC